MSRCSPHPNRHWRSCIHNRTIRYGKRQVLRKPRLRKWLPGMRGTHRFKTVDNRIHCQDVLKMGISSRPPRYPCHRSNRRNPRRRALHAQAPPDGLASRALGGRYGWDTEGPQRAITRLVLSDLPQCGRAVHDETEAPLVAVRSESTRVGRWRDFPSAASSAAPPDDWQTVTQRR